MNVSLTSPTLPTGSAARERANTRLVMLVGTLEYVISHCTDTNLAGALDLLSVGAEDLQALVGEHLDVEPAQRDCERIHRLVRTLARAFGLVDSLDYPDECGVLGLLNLAMSDVHSDVCTWLGARGLELDGEGVSRRLDPTAVHGGNEAMAGVSLEERFTHWSQTVNFGRGGA